MTVEMQAFNAYMGFMVACAVVTVAIPPLRLYILRHRPRNGLTLGADLFYGFAWVITVVLRAQETMWYVNERKIRLSAASEKEVMLDFINETFLKVDILLTVGGIKWQFFGELAQAAQLWAIKAAFLCFFWNLTCDGTLATWTVRFALNTMAVVLAGSYITLLVVFVRHCDPVSLNWNTRDLLSGNYCSPYLAFTPQIIWIVFTVVTDLMILGIPFLLMYSRGIHRTLPSIEKRALPLIFLIGSCSIVAALARFIIYEWEGFLKISGAHTHPMTAQQYNVIVLLANVEVMGAFIAFALPAFRFLLSSTFWEKKREAVTEMSSTTLHWATGRRKKRYGIADSELLRSEASLNPKEDTTVAAGTRLKEQDGLEKPSLHVNKKLSV